MIQPSSIDQVNDAAFQTMSVNPESLTVDDVEEKKRKQEKRREDGEKIRKKKKSNPKALERLGGSDGHYTQTNWEQTDLTSSY